jgi:short chain dehydrogenase
MMYCSRLLLIALSSFAVIGSTNAFFVQNQKMAGIRKSSTSTLNMVADNAQVVLVTGSSRGLGKSIALDIGSHGHKMIINYVSDSSKASADATVEQIKAAGGDAVAIQADCEYIIAVCVYVYSIVCVYLHIYILQNWIQRRNTIYNYPLYSSRSHIDTVCRYSLI